MKKKEKMEKRKAALVEAGFEADDVEDALAAFDSLADEAFDSVVAMYGKKKPMADKHGDMKKKEKEAEAGMPPEVKEKMEEMKKKKEKEAKAEDEAEAQVSEEIFEDVETSEATLVEAEVSDETETARASVSDWFTNNIFNK